MIEDRAGKGKDIGAECQCIRKGTVTITDNEAGTVYQNRGEQE
jgi:hypothetical protein